MLGSFGDLAFDLKQVAALKSLESEEVVVVVSGIVDFCIDFVGIQQDVIVGALAQQGRGPASLVLELIEPVGDLSDVAGGALVQGVDADAVGQQGVVGVDDGHVGASLGDQLRDFLARHT